MALAWVTQGVVARRLGGGVVGFGISWSFICVQETQQCKMLHPHQNDKKSHATLHFLWKMDLTGKCIHDINCVICYFSWQIVLDFSCKKIIKYWDTFKKLAQKCTLVVSNPPINYSCKGTFKIHDWLEVLNLWQFSKHSLYVTSVDTMATPKGMSKLTSQSSKNMTRQTPCLSNLCTVFTSLQNTHPDQCIFATIVEVW
jgi:hypothetical protein